MKFVSIIFGVVAVLLIGGFAYLAVTDVPVTKTTVTRTIPNERFFNAN